MALDFMACASNGVYPTPTPTTTRRAGLGVSFGLLNIIFPTGGDTGILRQIYTIGLLKFQWLTKRLIGGD